MLCPACKNQDTKVVDSRLSGDGLCIRRRRECVTCRRRFSTVEEMEILDMTVIKRGGQKEAYARQKIEDGLRKALNKRPCTPERFRSLMALIERDIQKKGQNQVAARDIGEIVMRHLRRFDQVAYLRFASVYLSFDSPERFRDELERMVAAPG